ncbi:hypothetical protein V8C86DRAFT_2439927, partial [Haematococcus lacustris]
MSLSVVVRDLHNKEITRFAANTFLAAKFLKIALEEHKLCKVEINVDGSVRLLQKFADVDYNRLARVLWRNRYDKAWEASGAQNNWGMFSTAGEVVEAVIYSHVHDEAPSQTPPASLELLPPLQQSGGKKQTKLLSEVAGQPGATPSRPNKQSIKHGLHEGREQTRHHANCHLATTLSHTITNHNTQPQHTLTSMGFDFQGFVTSAEIYTFFEEIHVMWGNMGEYADLAIYHVVDEILDMPPSATRAAACQGLAQEEGQSAPDQSVEGGCWLTTACHDPAPLSCSAPGGRAADLKGGRAAGMACMRAESRPSTLQSRQGTSQQHTHSGKVWRASLETCAAGRSPGLQLNVNRPEPHWSSVSQHQVAAGSLPPAMMQHRHHAQRQCSDSATATGSMACMRAESRPGTPQSRQGTSQQHTHSEKVWPGSLKTWMLVWQAGHQSGSGLQLAQEE